MLKERIEASAVLLQASRVAAGASLLMTAWYSASALRVALPEPGATSPFYPTYVDAGFAWAAFLALALAPVLRLASPSLLLLSFAPPWALAVASLAVLPVHRKGVVQGLLWALLALVFLALAELSAAAVGLAPPGIFSHVERCLRLFASTATLPLVVALLLLGPLKYLEALLQRGERAGGSSSKVKLSHLLPAIALALAVTAAPYLPTLNPSARMIGVDPNVYYPQWLRELSANFTLSHFALRERPVFVLSLYGLSQLLGEYWALRVVQLLCLASLTAATYYFTLLLAGEEAARLAALLTPLSYTTTVTLHSGYLNNAMATSMLLPALALLDRWSRGGSVGDLAVAVALYEVAIFTHPFSALFYSIALAGTAILRRGRRGWMLLALALAMGAQAELQSGGFGEQAAAHTLASRVLPLSREWVSVLAFVVYNCAVNAAVDLANWLLAVAGLAKCKCSLLTSIAALGAAALLSNDWVLVWRPIYALPLAVYQALALHSARREVKALALLSMANYTLNFITNIA